MYGSTQNPPEFYEEYVSLNQLSDLEMEDKNKYYQYHNVAGCILIFASCYWIMFYVYYNY